MSEPGKAVFLSYASQDAEAARKICESLRGSGVEVWFDADGGLEQGDEWDAKIRKQIKECVLFVPIISANTQSRLEGYFRIEWDLAAERARGIASGVPFILPIVIDGTRGPDAFVPDRFRAVQWTKLPGGEVPQDVLQRFLKLWSRRVGAVSHESAVGASLDDARGRAQGGPLHERPRRWLLPAIIGAAVIAVGATLWLTLGSGQQPAEKALLSSAQPPATEDARLVAQAWKLLYDHGMSRAQLDSADQLCRRAAEIAPTNPDVWAAWSHVNTWFVFHRFDDSASRRENARDFAARAMQFAPHSFEARLAQAFYWHRGGSVIESQIREAEKMLRALNEQRPDDPRVMLILGTLLLRNGEDWESGRKLLERLGEGTSLAAVAWMELGYNLHFKGRYSEAEQDIDRSIAAGAYWNNLSLKARLALYWHGDLEAAKAWMARMPPADMQEDFAVAVKCDVDFWSREPEQAVRLLLAHPRDWLDSNPYDGPKALLLGEARLMAGREESARRDFQLALELTESRLKQDPNDARLLQHKAVALHFLGDQDGARKAYRQSRDNGLSSRSLERMSMLLQPPEELLDELEAGFGSPTQLTTAAALRLNPRLDPLRANPRFKTLLARAEASPLHTPTPTNANPPAAANDKSVAVLAFANLSDDKDNEYFSDGISEELLNVLAKIPGLKVTARTSSFSFKDSKATVQEIDGALGVNFLVEGSVRKAGDSVRIAARLSRASTNEQVWSESYTRELKDVFAVQSEIAGTIVAQIRERLETGVDSAARAEIRRQVGDASHGGTTNTEAYNLFLRANHQSEQSSADGFARASQFYQQAIGIDPKFAAAWGGLARLQAITAATGYSESYGAGYEAARISAHRALEIDPDQPLALATLARIQVSYDWDWEEGRKTSERAIAVAPNTPSVRDAAMWLAIVEGDEKRALMHARAAVDVDPLDIAAAIRLTLADWIFENYNAAMKDGRRVMELNPRSGFGRYAFVLACIGARNFEEARKAQDASDPGYQLTCGALIAAAEGRKDEADAKAEQLAQSYSHQIAYQIGQVRALNGEPDLAFKWLEEAYRQRDSGMTFLRCDPFLKPLHQDPRWNDLIRRMRMN